MTIRASADVDKQIKARRTRAVMARFRRLAWRSKMAGDDLGPWLVRQARDDGRWARGVAYRHPAILQRIWTDAAVGGALGEAYGQLTPEEQGMDDLDFAERCVERSQDRYKAEVEAGSGGAGDPRQALRRRPRHRVQ